MSAAGEARGPANARGEAKARSARSRESGRADTRASHDGSFARRRPKGLSPRESAEADGEGFALCERGAQAER